MEESNKSNWDSMLLLLSSDASKAPIVGSDGIGGEIVLLQLSSDGFINMDLST